MSAGKSSRKRKHSEERDESAEALNWSDDEGTYVDGIYIPPPIKPVTCHTSSTRLVITKITNTFFKSYGENVILGPFMKCFNAIIGPNGSGKSNVIDSMLFVFGYRAAKIRSKKLSVLIHNSAKYQNIQSCTVSVHFREIIDKPGDEYEVVPNSDFVVSRTAFKDNSSYYELNGKRVQFKEVAKLLKSFGIDLDHNRFLILQGEVEEIAMMKCKGANENETGMLEYLEDIIGTCRYKKTLFELTERIEHLSALRGEKLNRLRLVQKELDELEAPMREAVDFLLTENKVAYYKNILYQKQIDRFEQTAQKIEEEKREFDSNREKLMERLEILADEKSENESILKEKSTQYDKLQQRREKLKEAYNAADKKDVQLRAEMQQTNTNRKKYKKQLNEEKVKLAELEGIPEKNKKSIAELEKKEVELTEKKEKLVAKKSQLLATIGDETKEDCMMKEKLEMKLGKLKETVDSTKSAYNLAESELKIARSQEETEATKLTHLRKSLADCESTLKERTKEVAELKRKIPPTEKSLLDAKRELESVKIEEVELKKQIQKHRISLEENKASMQMSSSRGRVLDALMQQKREGNCPGLFGRLGDLGGIDSKYDVAISTACGALDNIVVDTADTAQWCIEFLKKRGLERTTFIPLDRQEYLREIANTKIKTPENVVRLFDVIDIQNEEVRTAFYYALRDTLVANDLDQATRIAYGERRFRVVTLKGEIIETSGTMSGGGRSVSRGRMGRAAVVTTSNAKDIKKMEAILKENEEKMWTVTQRQTSLESQINTLQTELDSMKFNLQKYSRELQALKDQQPHLQNQLETQEKISKSTKSDAKEIQKLTAAVETKKNEFEKASAAAQEIQCKVDAVTRKIKDKTTGKTREVEKSLNENSKLLEKCTAEITKLNVAISTSERNAKKSAQKITTLEENITNAENSLRKMNDEINEIEVDAKKLLECIEDVTTKIEEETAGFADLKSKISAITKEEQKLLPKKCDLELNLKTINERLNECNAGLHQWHAKLSQLKLHDIPENIVEENPDAQIKELNKLSAEELASQNTEHMELELQRLQNNLKSIKPNLTVIQEYRAGKANYVERAQELDTVTNKRNEIKTLHDKVKTQRKDEFMVGYNVIRMKLKEMYQMITLGGDADFEIVDSFDPFAEGIQFNVKPPKKSWKNISNLSGGEKTLSSLALVFALHYYKPSPLYVMDEIDAALDFKNVSIVGHYIKERTKNAQFIIISLRSNMFELCDNLIGIYKICNCTRTITINPHKFDDEVAGQQPQISPVEKKESPETNPNGNIQGSSEEPMEMS